MSCPLIYNNNDIGGFCDFNFNWKYYLWPLQCCCEIHIFLWNFSLFWKSCRTLKVMTMPWVALMSCPLIYNNSVLGGLCHYNFNWKWYLWHPQCCCEIHIFLWNFALFWKSCRTLEVMTMPWVALMSCPLIYNNSVLGGLCHYNFNWKWYLWHPQCCCEIHIFLWNFALFWNRVGL